MEIISHRGYRLCCYFGIVIISITMNNIQASDSHNAERMKTMNETYDTNDKKTESSDWLALCQSSNCA